MSKGYVDADGHVMEDAEDILRFVRAPYNNRGTRNWIPSLDHFHTPADGTPRTPGTFDPNTGPEQWLEFLDKTGTDYTVLYPTTGLAYGNVAYPQWALAYAQGYNDYIHARYLKRSPRFQAVALIPMQHVPDAVTELRRAVKDLGFIGAMIPSNGLTRHVSHPEYWPIYEEAEKLNCIMAVHGGSYINLGFNTYTVFPATRALGMPFPLAIALTGMMVDGLLDRFPKLRFVFLESGAGWLPYWFYRLDEHYEVLGNQVPELKTMPSKLLERGQLYFSCEADETEIPHVIETIGDDWIVFASDYSHFDSRFPGASAPIIDNQKLSETSKRKILNDNARRLYPLL